MNIIGILLAAGQSTRMGQAKQLLDINGEPLITYTAKKLLAVTGNFRLITVLGAQATQIQSALHPINTDIVVNKDYKKGMGTSLIAALQYIKDQQLQPTAILLSVCDQPYLTTALLQDILKKHRESPTNIIASRYHENFGVPALIPSHFFSELFTLKADRGAKKIMLQYASELSFIDFPKGNIDLDTPTDYKKFITTNTSTIDL